MIPRYSHPDMVKIWEDQNKYQTWLDIEIAVCEVLHKKGLIDQKDLNNIKEKADFDVKRIQEIELEVKHDVIAFLTNVAEYVGDSSRFIHYGLTSSDILDTSFNLLLKQSGNLLIQQINNILIALKKRAEQYKYQICVGRSHGIHAEPTSFGLKIAGFYVEMKRNQKRLELAIDEISVCAISGAVGTFANTEPDIEKQVAIKLQMQPETISTQIIPRDRHATFFSCLGIIASSIERFAVEIRHLQRTEVLEVEELFSEGQKGSSAMPHKRNPVLCENLTGLARMIRSYVTPAMENIALWHERDISHSSVERMIGPDACITLDFALRRLLIVVEKFVAYPEQMKKNLNQLRGLCFSQQILLALVAKGVSREKAYKIVQRNSMEVWKNSELDFKKKLLADTEVMNFFSQEEVEKYFDEKYHLRYVDDIYNRVFHQE